MERLLSQGNFNGFRQFWNGRSFFWKFYSGKCVVRIWNDLWSWQANKNFASIQFSSADLTVGETYTVIIADETSEVTVETISTTTDTTTGQMGGGMEQPGGDKGMGQPSTNGLQQPNEAESEGQPF